MSAWAARTRLRVGIGDEAGECAAERHQQGSKQDKVSPDDGPGHAESEAEDMPHVTSSRSRDASA